MSDGIPALPPVVAKDTAHVVDVGESLAIDENQEIRQIKHDSSQNDDFLNFDVHSEMENEDYATTFDESAGDTDLLYSKSDERFDINAAVEHLIVSGNYYRHQQWRVSEWERYRKITNINAGYDINLVAHSSNNDNKNNKTHDPGDPINKRPRREQSDSLVRTIPAGIGSEEVNDSVSRQPQILHAQDARLYNTEKNEGMEPDMWPKLPFTVAKEASLTDRQWDIELSDSIHPIAFHILRRSDVVYTPFSHSSSNDTTHNNICDSLVPPLADYDLNPNITNNNSISSNEAVRAMVLHCWDRAVHAAATTTTTINIEPNVDSASILVQNAVLKSAVTTSTTSKSNKNKRNRDEAIITCQKLQIRDECQERLQSYPNVDTDDNRNEEIFQCNVCRIEFPTKDMLHDHFFGNVETEKGGCCWTSIERKRRTMSASVLESDVTTLIQQLVNHILFHPDLLTLRNNNSNTYNYTAPPTQQPKKSFVDAFDVLRMLEHDLSTSRMIMTATTSTNPNGNNNNNNKNDDVVMETLQLSSNESPLPINAAILEAVRYRLIDRYGKIPR